MRDYIDYLSDKLTNQLVTSEPVKPPTSKQYYTMCGVL